MKDLGNMVLDHQYLSDKITSECDLIVEYK